MKMNPHAHLDSGGITDAIRNVTANPERYAITAPRILDDPRIERTDSCWLWKGSRTKGGYGRRHKKYVHRLVYEQEIGPIPKGYEVMHSCDTPPCVNPEHLRAGTHRENMQDAWAKGRISAANLVRCSNGMCRKGLHPMEDGNLYIDPQGVRECLACKRQRRKEWGERNGR